MLFLKQLDEDVSLRTDGDESNERRRHVVVWEQETLGLLREIEEDKEKMNRTDYKKALKPKKPRPRHVMNKMINNDDSSVLLDKMDM